MKIREGIIQQSLSLVTAFSTGTLESWVRYTPFLIFMSVKVKFSLSIILSDGLFSIVDGGSFPEIKVVTQNVSFQKSKHWTSRRNTILKIGVLI